jgi:hypothetical protein
MYYFYVEIEYVAMSFSPARTDLALKLLGSLIVLSVGLKNDDGADLVDLEIDLWKSLPANSTKPQKEDYADGICLRYVAENLWVTANMKREPRPKQWDRTKMHTWLQDHPIMSPDDVQFIREESKRSSRSD